MDKRQEIREFPTFVSEDEFELRKQEWELCGYTVAVDYLGFVVSDEGWSVAAYTKNRHDGRYQRVLEEVAKYHVHTNECIGTDMDDLWEELCGRK